MGLLPPRINDVETGRTPQYPDVQPLAVRAPAEKVFGAISAVAGRMDRWTVVKVDRATHTLLAEARSKLWRFIDDVTVRVEADGAGSRVHMRSRSRMGKSDFGANAARIRTFLRLVARELPGEADEPPPRAGKKKRGKNKV